ncbi:hypothetical protein SADUNF_Sadunf09G0026900 [Salix dunnii]|uniref:Uncharacterized protein n=1 Tax=Salix dunnii TaxID=1413687 RepID=A0A835JXC7_9ROSI|nr:hypothetical protein SADUNF_Sadunf09G0026900 [Salix dunnii]
MVSFLIVSEEEVKATLTHQDFELLLLATAPVDEEKLTYIESNITEERSRDVDKRGKVGFVLVIGPTVTLRSFSTSS